MVNGTNEFEFEGLYLRATAAAEWIGWDVRCWGSTMVETSDAWTDVFGQNVRGAPHTYPVRIALKRLACFGRRDETRWTHAVRLLLLSRRHEVGE